MESQSQPQQQSKKRTIAMLPNEIMGSFSGKQSFYQYLKEYL